MATDLAGPETAQSRTTTFARAATWLRERPWTALTLVLYGFTILLPSLSRYFTWDEAVFYSQSGGLNGASAREMPLVASRELGSSALIGVLRTVADGLTEVRFLWATLTFLLLLLGARRLVPHIGERAALVFLAVYGSYWLVLAFMPAFYANSLFAVFGLLAVTFYLDLLDRPNERHVLATGALLGLCLAGTFAMRPLETGLLVVALAAHLIVFRPRRVRSAAIPVAISGAVAAVAVGIPWVIDSLNRFGSIGERISSALNQPGQVRSGLRFNLDEYLGVWVGDYLSEQAFGPVPYWPRWIIYAGMAAALVLIVVALVRRGAGTLRGPAGVFLLAGWAHASFFLFWREAVADRYHFGSMIFAAAIFGWAFHTVAPIRLGRRSVGLLTAVAAVWLVGQVTLITSYDHIRSEGSEQVARVAATMRTLSDDGPCRAMSRYGAPQVEIASGCRVTSYQAWDEVLSRMSDNPNGLPSFVYGPARDGHFVGLPNGWVELPVTVGDGQRHFRFAYWLPSEQETR